MVNDLTIASLEGFACFERDEDLEDRGGLEMAVRVRVEGFHGDTKTTEVQTLEQLAELVEVLGSRLGYYSEICIETEGGPRGDTILLLREVDHEPNSPDV